jgi:hypothetical protein
MRFRRRASNDPKGLIPDPTDEELAAQFREYTDEEVFAAFREWVLELDRDPGDPPPPEPAADPGRARAMFDLVTGAIHAATEATELRSSEVAYLWRHVARCFGMEWPGGYNRIV